MSRTFEEELANLNCEQRRAVTYGQGPLLVIAGAGSGKTRVATMRVAFLVKQNVQAQSIVGVTFTNKAAKEMRERVHQLVGSQLLVSTFHSLGARILREFITLLEYPSTFSIYDEDESEKVLKDCLKDRGLQTNESTVGAVRASISKIKNTPSFLDHLDQLTKSLFEEYQRRLKQSGAVDFDDLIYLPLELFKNFPMVLERCWQRWHYILVDEYQDTSESQCEFASSLTGSRMNIFAVGDPDQSIYSWRGAKVSNILSFQKRFPGAEVIRLEQNYRSTNTILAASNALIGCNEARYEKRLWSERGNGDPIVRFLAKTERQEAEFVVGKMQDLHDRGVSYDHMAILYRTNAQSRSLEDKLLEERVPYRIWGGTPFYARKEIRDVLSFLQVAAVPQDMVAFERALHVLGCGVGDVTIKKIRQIAISNNSPIFEIAAGDSVPLTKRQKEGIAKFCSIIDGLQKRIEEGSAYALVSAAVRSTGYLEILGKDEETAQERKENVEQLLGRAKEWEESHEGMSPLLFLEELMLEGAREQGEKVGECVTLATVHNAKGLEFGNVFLVGLEEDLFPHINAKKGTAEIEEERRLFYVGMTRAKDRLFMSSAQVRFVFGGARSMRVSRFWQEVPKQYVEAVFSSVSSKPLFQEPETPKPVAERFSMGQVVVHPQFGIGRIEAVLMTGAGEAYEVFFSNDQTKKKILAAYAPLKVVGGR